MPSLRGYHLPVAIRQTGTTAAASVVWSMRNLGARPLFLRTIMLNALFDGTGAATSSQYQLMRFRTATPTTGTALTVVKNNNGTDTTGATAQASGVTDARFLDTGLSITSVTFDTAFASCGAPRTVGAAVQYTRSWAQPYEVEPTPFIIAPQDGLCIVLGVTAVIGDGLQGWIEWNELGGQG